MMIEIKRRGRPTRWTEATFRQTVRMTADDWQMLKIAWMQQTKTVEKLTFNDWIVNSAKAVAQLTIET